MLNFSSFHTESNWDYLYLYDADSGSGVPTETLHGRELPSAFVATGSVAVARYQSDGSVSGDGFAATFSCVSSGGTDEGDPSAAVDPCAGGGISLVDEGNVSLARLSDNQQCTWSLSCSDAHSHRC